MLLEENNKPVVRFDDVVEAYLNELIEILLEQGYFDFKNSAKQYVLDMKDYVVRNFLRLPKYPAPPYFSKYESGMKYVIYKPNKRTTWYHFFVKKGNRYLVCYITNNHFEGQYIR